MTPEPVSCCPEPLTLIDTTDGRTCAAIAAYDLGLAASDDVDALETLKPPAPVVDEPPSPSSAAPIPMPAPPNTSAEAPAAIAGTNQPGRCRRRRGGSHDGCAPGRSSCSVCAY